MPDLGAIGSSNGGKPPLLAQCKRCRTRLPGDARLAATPPVAGAQVPFFGASPGSTPLQWPTLLRQEGRLDGLALQSRAVGVGAEEKGSVFDTGTRCVCYGSELGLASGVGRTTKRSVVRRAAKKVQGRWQRVQTLKYSDRPPAPPRTLSPSFSLLLYARRSFLKLPST
jgi:hypothetical protein